MLTPEQIAALPELVQTMKVSLTDRLEVGFLCASLADANLRIADLERGGAPEGKVLVSEGELREFLWKWAETCHCSNPCPMIGACNGAPNPSDADMDEDSEEWAEATANYCYGMALAHFGLTPEQDVTP